MSRGAALLLLALGALLAAPDVLISGSADSPRPCVVTTATCRDSVALVGDARLTYYRTFSLAEPNHAVKRGVLVIHGGQRTPERYFKAIIDSATAAGAIDDSLIVAPGFKIPEDKPAKEDLWWDKDDGWKKGDLSTSERPVRISSFEVADRFVTMMADRHRFPNLREIVVTGHSSGGQFTQRYAAGTRVDREMGEVPIRFVVANPSSYLYFSPDRPTPGAPGEFSRPEGTCDYDKYKHGVSGRNEYMSRVDVGAMIDQYRRRDVTYLLGTADVDPNHDGLDRSCAGMTQGRFRYERGIAFKAYMDRFFSPHHHRVIEVPGVAHEGEKMFGSLEGRRALFTRTDTARRDQP